MNGSRNTSYKRKNRYRHVMVLILLALAGALLASAGVGQQAPVGSGQNSDAPVPQESRQHPGNELYMPPLPRLPSGSPAPTLEPQTRTPAVRPLTEKTPRSEPRDLAADSSPVPNFPPARSTQHAAGPMFPFSPVLRSPREATVVALAPNRPWRGPAPPKYTIPLSAVQPSGEIEVSTHNGLVSLIAWETPLNEILSIIAQSQRLNLVCAEDVTARISITLHAVTLDDALTAILSTAGYTWFLRNGIIQVTSVADARSLSPEVQGRVLEVFPLDYVSAIDVDDVVKGLLSSAGQSFPVQGSSTDLRKTRESLVVEDLPIYLARVREYIFQVDQPPRQVLIEAHILEVTLEDENKHGVNFEHLFSVAANSVTLSTTGFANPLASQAFFATVEGGNLAALIEILQTTTDAKTLACPRILVVNGQTARIQIGEQLGFRVITTTETSTMESVEFLETGVVLSVTPNISRDNRVLMEVKPEVSTGSVNPETGLPEEETTEVETNVLLSDGQGILIGGLIREVDSVIQSKIPFLGDLWLVGTLFQRRQVRKHRSEIIISLVARIIPYEPRYQAYDDSRIQSSWTPLTEGPLRKYPRPWEARLPDPLLNPGPLIPLPAVQRLPVFPPRQHLGGGWDEIPPIFDESDVFPLGEETPEPIAFPPPLSL